MPTQDQIDLWNTMTPEQQAYVLAVNGGTTTTAPTTTESSLSFGGEGTSTGDGVQFNYITGQYEYGIPKQEQTVYLGGGGTTISDFETGEELATGYYNDGVFEPVVSDGPTQEQLDRFYSSTPEQQEKFVNWVNAGSPGGAEGLAQLSTDGPTQEQLDRFYSSTPEQQQKFVNWVNEGSPGGPEYLQWLENQNTYGTGTPTQPTTQPPAQPPTGGSSQPPTGGYNQPSTDTSWDWAQFQPPGGSGWGGYDPNYGAYERYVPGQESPWGNPNYEGGNQEFYQQQFANLLRGEQDFRSRQQASQEQAAAAAQSPYQSAPTDWSWAYGGEGLPTVWEAGQTQPRQLLDQYSGMTNQQVIDALSGTGSLEAPQIDWLTNAATNAGTLDQNVWASGNYDANYNNTVNSSLAPDNKQTLYQVYNALYAQPQAPQAPSGVTVPTGYASPVNF